MSKLKYMEFYLKNDSLKPKIYHNFQGSSDG